MPIADEEVDAKSADDLLSDDLKNQHAANTIKNLCVRSSKQAQRLISRLNDIVAAAPGDKVAVLAKLSAGDKTEVEAIAAAQVLLFNDHSANPDISF